MFRAVVSLTIKTIGTGLDRFTAELLWTKRSKADRKLSLVCVEVKMLGKSSTRINRFWLLVDGYCEDGDGCDAD